MLDAAVGELGNVDQPFDLVAIFHRQAGEGAELRQLGDLPLHELALAQLARQLLPRVRLELAHRQADAPALGVDRQHFDLHFLADLEHLARMAQALPRDLRQVHQTIGAADVDEGAEVSQGNDAAGAHLARLELDDQQLLERLARLARRRPLREDQPVAAPVDLDHFGQDRLADHLAPALVGGLAVRPAAARRADLGCRDEAAQVADLDNQAALVIAADRPFIDRLLLLQRLGPRPVGLFHGPGGREHDAEVSVAGAHDVYRQLTADDQFRPLFLVHLLDLGGGDHTFRLGANVHQDVVAADAGNRSGSGLAPTGRIHPIGFLFQEGIHRMGFGALPLRLRRRRRFEGL